MVSIDELRSANIQEASVRRRLVGQIIEDGLGARKTRYFIDHSESPLGFPEDCSHEQELLPVVTFRWSPSEGWKWRKRLEWFAKEED